MMAYTLNPWKKCLIILVVAVNVLNILRMFYTESVCVCVHKVHLIDCCRNVSLWCCRHWRSRKRCFYGTNSAVRLPCWIFSGQHDPAACEPDRHGHIALIWLHLKRLVVAVEPHRHCTDCYVLLLVLCACTVTTEAGFLTRFIQSSDVTGLLMRIVCNWALLSRWTPSCVSNV